MGERVLKICVEPGGDGWRVEVGDPLRSTDSAIVQPAAVGDVRAQLETVQASLRDGVFFSDQELERLERQASTALGSLLWEGPLGREVSGAVGRSRVAEEPLVVAVEDRIEPGAGLPWELLAEPGDVPLEDHGDATIVRLVPGREHPPPPLRPGAPRLALWMPTAEDEALGEVRDALRALCEQLGLEGPIPWSPAGSTGAAAGGGHAERPTFLHVLCHGDEEHGGLAAGAHGWSVSTVVRQLHARVGDFETVVLDVCGSGGDSATPPLSVGAALIRTGAACCVAPFRTEASAAAVAFARGFYGGLVAGKTVPWAMREGRTAVKTAALLDHRGRWWGRGLFVASLANLQRVPVAAAAPTASPVHLTPGTRLGAYELRARIGHGGVSVVWRAIEAQRSPERNGPPEREVALKILREESADAPEVVRRFRRSARYMGEVGDHPGIVGVRQGVFEAGGHSILAVDLVDGPDMQTACEDARWSRDPSDVLNIVEQVADALAHAHARGFVHRDVKPSNILLGSMGPKLADFDLAWPLQDRETRFTTTVGTYCYMPPEAVSGTDRLDGRADQYALAVTALRGLMPADSDDQQLVQPFDVLNGLARLPRACAAVLARALQPVRDARFASMCEFVDALRTARRAPPRPNPGRWRDLRAARKRRRSLLVALAGALVLAAAAAAAFLLVDGADTERLRAEQSTREVETERLAAVLSQRANAERDEQPAKALAYERALASTLGRPLDAERVDGLCDRGGGSAVLPSAEGGPAYAIPDRDGSGALVLGSDGVLKRWDLVDGHVSVLDELGPDSEGFRWDSRRGRVALALGPVVQLRDARGALLGAWRDDTGGALDVRLADDGEAVFVSQSDPCAVRLFRVGNQRVVARFEGLCDSLVASGGGRYLFGLDANSETPVRGVDLEQRRPLPLTSLAALGDVVGLFGVGRSLGVARGDGALDLWDPVADSLLQRFSGIGMGAPVTAVELSPSGEQLVAWGSAGALALFQAGPASGAGWRQVGPPHRPDVSSGRYIGTSASWLRGARNPALVVGERGGGVRLWQLAGPWPPISDRLWGHGTEARAAFAGRDVVSSSNDGTVRVWRRLPHRTTSPRRWSQPSSLEISYVSLLDEGDHLVVHENHAGIARVIDMRTGAEVASLRAGFLEQWEPVFGSSAAHVRGDKIVLSELLSGDEQELPLAGLPHGANARLAIVPERPGRVVSCAEGQAPYLLDFSAGTISEIATGLGFEPRWCESLAPGLVGLGKRSRGGDEEQLALAHVEQTGVEVRCARRWPTPDGARAWPRRSASSPDGRWLAVPVRRPDAKGLPNYGATVIEVATCRDAAQLEGHRDQVYQVRFSPDGALLASASFDGSARLWRVPSGELVHELRVRSAFDDDVNAVAFGRKGRLLLTGHDDGAVRLWEIAGGRLVDTWRRPNRGDVRWIDVSPGGGYVASSLGTGEVVVWRLDEDALEPVPTGVVETGGLTNYRICEGSLEAVAVNPFPSAATVWAPAAFCER